MSKANPVSYRLIRLPRHHSSCLPRHRRRIRPHVCHCVPWRLGHGSGPDTHAAAREPRRPAPGVARKKPLHDGRRSDSRDQVSLVDVGRPRPSTMKAAASALADPGSRVTGQCAGQGSLGRSGRTRAQPPRTRSPSPEAHELRHDAVMRLCAVALGKVDLHGRGGGVREFLNKGDQHRPATDQPGFSGGAQSSTPRAGCGSAVHDSPAYPVTGW
jgi:hypothetical protein